MLLGLSGCSMSESVTVAKKAVGTFHAELNHEQFDTILSTASPEYQRTLSPDQNRKLFAAIHKKLGEAHDFSVKGWFLNFTPTGKMVRLQCNTNFASGVADETFVWRVTEAGASLVGYNINSTALITQ